MSGDGAPSSSPLPPPGAVDPRVCAEVLAGYCLEVAAGDQVLVRASTEAAPLLAELQRAILARRAWPLFEVTLPGIGAQYAAAASGDQLDQRAPAAVATAGSVDATLNIFSEAPGDAFDRVPASQAARYAAASGPLVHAERRTKWCYTLWPTSVAAARAGMTLPELEQFVTAAMMVDRPDPVAAWNELEARQQGLADRLARARQIRIEAPGTDLRLGVDGRKWINSGGRRNMPSGEVFTGPVETSVDGHAYFDIPSSLPGTDVAGVRLEFRHGEVVAASAERGQDQLERLLRTDAGMRRVGELGIGTNFSITRAIGATLFDEKIGGTVHVALGSAYAETGSRNESALHWDLICDLRGRGRLIADGEVISERGRLSYF
jgi:aminopeptidase